MTIKEAFEKLSASMKKSMKNPFFIMRSLKDDFDYIAANIEGGGGDIDASDVSYGDDSTVEDALNSLSEGHVYSTTEQKIGKWIDGKDLYRKVIVTSEVTLSSGTAVELNLSDYLTGYDKLIKADSIQNTANRVLPANLLPSNLQAYGVSIDVNFNTGKITIRSGASVSTTDTFTCILYYTKSST